MGRMRAGDSHDPLGSGALGPVVQRLQGTAGLWKLRHKPSPPYALISWCLFGVYFYSVPERITRMDRLDGKVLEASVDADFLTLR
jgi:hypothetical protein